MFNSTNTTIFNYPTIIRYNYLRLGGLPLPNNRLWLIINSSEFIKRRVLPSNIHPILF